MIRSKTQVSVALQFLQEKSNELWSLFVTLSVVLHVPLTELLSTFLAVSIHVAFN